MRLTESTQSTQSITRNLLINQTNFDEIYKLYLYTNLDYLEFNDIKFSKSFKFPQLPTSLTKLKIFKCVLEYLESKLPDSLESFICISSELKKIPKLPETIKMVFVDDNKIEHIPKLADSILELDVSDNPIQKINSFPPNLLSLGISNTKIKQFPKYPETITKLNISKNKMQASKLLANLPPNLEYLDISYNNLESIGNLPDTLDALYIGNNKIRKIVKLPPKLTEFVCCNNYLYELPFIPDSVIHLEIQNNNIKNFVNFPLNLKYFHCHHNNLPQNLMKYFIENKNNILTVGFSFANTLMNIEKSKEMLLIIKKELMLKRDIICMHPNRVARLLYNNEISFDGDDERMKDL